MERSWTTTGTPLVKRLGQKEVEDEIEAFDWQPVEAGMEIAFSPGHAIKTAIQEFGLPKVSAIALSGFSREGGSEEDGFYPGFYGIEANYVNGRARVYLLDTGVELIPLASDHWPVEAAETKRKRTRSTGVRRTVEAEVYP